MNTLLQKEKIWSVRDNWHLFKPFLKDENVEFVLYEALEDFMDQYIPVEEWEDVIGQPPWKYTKYTKPENWFTKYFEKHCPKEGTIEYYQFFGGCHWINQFTAKLIEKALNVETDIWSTDTHTVARFVKEDVIYYADILNEWENVRKLENFMDDWSDF